MPSPDLTALTAAITTGLANLTNAVSASQPVDLDPLVAQITRVADAVEDSNTQIASVIKVDTAGDSRVLTDPNAP